MKSRFEMKNELDNWKFIKPGAATETCSISEFWRNFCLICSAISIGFLPSSLESLRAMFVEKWPCSGFAGYSTVILPSKFSLKVEGSSGKSFVLKNDKHASLIRSLSFSRMLVYSCFFVVEFENISSVGSVWIVETGVVGSSSTSAFFLSICSRRYFSSFSEI